MKIPPSRESLKHILSGALQTAFGLQAKAVHGLTWVAAHVYVREETPETEAVVAGLRLENGFLYADICGQESGTLFYEAKAVNLGVGHTGTEAARAASGLAFHLAEARAANPEFREG